MIRGEITEKVVALLLKKELTPKQIAAEVGCRHEYVRTVAYRNGLSLITPYGGYRGWKKVVTTVKPKPKPSSRDKLKAEIEALKKRWS